MINQIGFMVVGIGLGTDLALNGAVSHAFNDVVFKGLLFMSMGAVLHMTGKINGSELGGLYKTMPITTVLCIVGAASISAFPLFSGFVSKSMVMASAIEEGHDWVWLVLLFASAGVFHHAGIKIPFFAFFAHDSGIRVKDPPWNMLIAMCIAAAICVFNGSYPWVLYSLLPWPVDYAPYTWTHVMTQTQLLFFSALAFIFLKLTGLYPPELPSINIDAEWSYRRLVPRAVRRAQMLWAPVQRGLYQIANLWFERFIARLYRHHGPEGILGRTWLTGNAALVVAILLVAYLLLNFA
jgi:multicomponent Na+:H+ antiporter subunit D